MAPPRGDDGQCADAMGGVCAGLSNQPATLSARAAGESLVAGPASWLWRPASWSLDSVVVQIVALCNMMLFSLYLLHMVYNINHYLEQPWLHYLLAAVPLIGPTSSPPSPLIAPHLDPPRLQMRAAKVACWT